MDLGLRGAGVLVTGGSRGIGLTVAHVLADEGASVAVLGRDRAALEAAVASLGANSLPLVADTSDDRAVARAVETAAAELGGIDAVVNCAAPRALPGREPSGLAGLIDSDFMTQVDVKALGYLRVVRAALPHLVKSGGRVVNVSGMNARATGSITGSVRNLAVVGITKNLADDLGPQGVTVSCVHPGLTITDQVAGDTEFAESAAVNSLGRPVTAKEVADVVVFLASQRGAVANGAVITLDGGRPGGIWT